jgi:class 3 adenylate cyclase/tetratricopeptide (TPR) repeat protein/ribosomal protein L40E
MKCPNCQFENPVDAKFCNECGRKLELVCTHCNKLNPPGSKFCNECGHNLNGLTHPPALDYAKPQSYTPKYLAQKILKTRSSIEGERKIVTVFFADVANFTSLAEKLDPEDVHSIMDGAFQILMENIHRVEGTINQFTGDGVMALFGAPVAHEDHFQRACHAALSVQGDLKNYGTKVKKNYKVDFLMRIGINSGPVVVGSIGDDLRMDYTAIGNTTNLASRMETLAKPGTIMVSASTHRLARDFFHFKFIESVKIKGLDAPQKAYQLIRTSDVGTRIEASVVRGLTRFVGRKNSMAALLNAFEKVKTGSGQVIGLVGEAGVGKSRLLLEVRNRLPQDEYNYLEGYCLQYGGSIAYLPIINILRSYLGTKEGEPAFLVKQKMKEKILGLDKKLKSVIPPFQSLLSLPLDDEEFAELEPKEKRERTFEALRDMLIRSSQERPLILAVEDLHWIDNTSEEFLNYFTDWLANTPILLILLYRPEYTHQWGSKSFYTKVGLTQLGMTSSNELIKAILKEGEAAQELKQLIHNCAAGNPLFMEELSHTLLENGFINIKEEKYVLSSKASDIQVPDTIQGIIAARLDRLEDNLKRTMQEASVIGRDFAFRILQTITDMREELKSHLLNLQSLEFIYEKSLFPELEYIFKHALTQEVAYNSLLLKKRKEIHEKIGMAIEELYSSRLEEFYEILVYHYSKSDNLGKTYQFLKLSGEKLAKNYANWEAIDLYKEALTVLNKLPKNRENSKKQIEIYVLMGNTLALLGYPKNFLQILQEGERLAKNVGDEKNLASIYGHISGVYSHKGDQLLAIEYSENSFREANKIQDLDLMTPTAFSLCFAFQRDGQFSKAIDIASTIIDLIEKQERKSEFFGMALNAYSIFCTFYGVALGHLGKFERGKVFFEKALDNATNVGHSITLGLIELYYGIVLRIKGDGRLSIKRSQNSIKYYEEGEFIYPLGMAWSNLGYGYYLIEEFDKAQKYIEKGLKIQKDTGVEIVLSNYYIGLGMVHCDSGDLTKAQIFAEKALKLSQKNNDRLTEGISKIWLGRILAKRDLSQSDKAEEFIMDGIQFYDELGMKPFAAQGYMFLGELHVDAYLKEKAKNNLKKAEGMFRKMGMDYWLTRTREVLGRL